MIVEDQSVILPADTSLTIHKQSPSASKQACKGQHYPHEECELCGKQADLKVFHRKRVQSTLNTELLTSSVMTVLPGAHNLSVAQKSPTAVGHSSLFLDQNVS